MSLAAGCSGEGQEPADELDVAKTGAQAGDEQEDNGSFHPEMITVDPEVVEPGAEVEVRFPQGTNRAMVYYLERGREVGWHDPEWVLYPEFGDRDYDWDGPGYLHVDDEPGRPDGDTSGRGPDVVVIPEAIERGEHRLCAHPIEDQESGARRVSHNGNLSAVVELARTEVVCARLMVADG